MNEGHSNSPREEDSASDDISEYDVDDVNDEVTFRPNLERRLMKREPMIVEFHSLQQQEIGDPTRVTKLYICPVCLDKFLSITHAASHIGLFHNIRQEHFSRLGLQIKELDVSYLN